MSQVAKSHYEFGRYTSQERWQSYWHQIDEVLKFSPQNVLVIGVGDAIVPKCLEALGCQVTTFDFDANLEPNITGDITNIDKYVSEGEFDVILCSQVLEHIEFGFLASTYAKLYSIANIGVIISLPYCHRFLLSLTLNVANIFKMKSSYHFPRFWKSWVFDGEHYWEVGPRNLSLRKITKILLNVSPDLRVFSVKSFPYHMFFVANKPR